MIYTERTVKVKNGTASIDSPIILYRGDREVEVLFTIKNSLYKFSAEKGNYIEDTKAKWGQLAIDLPDGNDIFTDISECVDGAVLFKITGEMIDELHEVGFYSFHIRLYNDDMSSRITIPPIIEGVEIREPIVIEDDVNESVAIVDYGMVDGATINNDVLEFDDHLDIVWKKGDVISSTRLNQMIQYINEKAVPGEQGEQGPQGPQGEQGPPGESIKSDMTQNDISNNVLTLTKDKYQECEMLDGTEIVLPTLDIYEEIHLFFSTTSDITIIMPNGLKYQQIPSILANKTYEFIFTYTNTSKGWVFGYIEYEG